VPAKPQAKEDPAAYRDLPTRTDCPIGSADVDRTSHIRPAPIGGRVRLGPRESRLRMVR
jgi:hypothetical protein